MALPENRRSHRFRDALPSERPGRPIEGRAKDLETHIRCEICHRWFHAITYTHLRHRHGIEDPQRYKDDYSLDIITAPSVRKKISRQKYALDPGEVDYIRLHWGKRPLREMSVHLGKDASTIRAYAQRLGLGLLVEKWTPPKILRLLRRAHREHLLLSSGEARRSMSPLYKAAITHFGSWKKALQEARIPYEKVARRGPFESWTDERVIQEIRELQKKGLERDYRYLQRHRPKLYGAARNRFGSWAAALRIAVL